MKLKSQIKKVVNIRPVIFSISKVSLKRIPITKKTSPTFIIKVKSPKVIILKGKKTIFKIGFIKKLTSPRMAPDSKISLYVPENDIPGMYFVAINIPIIPERR